MIKALALTLILAFVGGTLADLLRLPVPGSAIGMVFLIAYFTKRGEVDSDFGCVFDSACPHFPLFFVPAAVGIVANAELLAQAWLQVVTVVAFGTIATMAVTGWLVQSLIQRQSEVETA